MGMFEWVAAGLLFSILWGSSVEKQKASANENPVNEDLRLFLQLAIILGILLSPVAIYGLLCLILK